MRRRSIWNRQDVHQTCAKVRIVNVDGGLSGSRWVGLRSMDQGRRGGALPPSTEAGRLRRCQAADMPTQAKTHVFPVSIRWLGGRITCAAVAGKPELTVATPPEFRSGVEGVWSPEDLLVASVATCFTVTLVSIAERRGLPLRSLGVRATGAVTQRSFDGSGFTEIE